jgi:hypothetical protein
VPRQHSPRLAAVTRCLPAVSDGIAMPDTEEVTGSNPVRPTRRFLFLALSGSALWPYNWPYSEGEGMPRSTGARSSPQAGTSAHMGVPTREGALPGGGSVPRFRTAYLRTDRRSARVLSESVYDPTLRHPLARSLVGGDHPVATILGRSHPGSGQILASGRLARHSSTGAPSRCCLPARQGDCSPAVCAQTCGSLVRNDPEPVHMQWKCWGFRCLCRTLIGT